MTTYAYLLDLGRCLGCQACVAACKTGNQLRQDVKYITISEKSWGKFPALHSVIENKRCYHCAEAACVSVCPTSALFKEDGLTRLERDKCSGCGYCVDACPFGIPKIAGDSLASKCDGCAEVVKAGGQPWCVKTCPSGALHYGEREEILAEARQRLELLKTRYPKARLYGESEAGGLGVIVVLPDDPETLDLPLNPQIPAAIQTWQKVVQPASLGLTGLAVLTTGLAAFIARRNHHKELERMRQQPRVKAASSPTSDAKESDR
ncbi:MAG: 4Fe-4S binding protein [Anaerolineae bacterium]|nr:4Fe-4S binding protein [Anaerolineae bacterium]